MPSGTAVRASPKLWIRSARSATDPDARKITAWIAAVAPSTARLDSDRPHAVPRAQDRTVDEAVRVPRAGTMIVSVLMSVPVVVAVVVRTWIVVTDPGRVRMHMGVDYRAVAVFVGMHDVRRIDLPQSWHALTLSAALTKPGGRGR